MHGGPGAVRTLPVDPQAWIDEARLGSVSVRRQRTTADVDHPALDRTPGHLDVPTGWDPGCRA